MLKMIKSVAVVLLVAMGLSVLAGCSGIKYPPYSNSHRSSYNDQHEE